MDANPALPSACPHCGTALDAAVLATAGEPRCPRCNRPLAPKAASTQTVAMKLLGLGMIVVGALGIYYFGYLPWQQIQESAPKLTLSLKGLFGSPIVLGVGLAFFLPDRPKAGESESLLRRIARGLVLTIVLGGAVGGTAAYFWLRALAQARGYEF